MSDKSDAGKHYRFTYKGIQLDPFRLARIYKITNPAQFTILKKTVRLGTGGKDKAQDLKDIISAAERELELMQEDGDAAIGEVSELCGAVIIKDRYGKTIPAILEEIHG